LTGGFAEVFEEEIPPIAIQLRWMGHPTALAQDDSVGGVG